MYVAKRLRKDPTEEKVNYISPAFVFSNYVNKIKMRPKGGVNAETKILHITLSKKKHCIRSISTSLVIPNCFFESGQSVCKKRDETKRLV